MKKIIIGTSLNLVVLLLFGCSNKSPEISGELKKWHKVTLTFNGPETSEMAEPNPFLFYRLMVTFSKEGKKYTVPGYFTADGNAAQSSSESGNKWRVHFAPDEEGTWKYLVSFRKGENIAISTDPDAGEDAGYMDGITGLIEVGPTDKLEPDLRAKGRLNYVGKHYLQFAETGDYFLKMGADAPENLLAYQDFDGDFKIDGYKDELIKNWEPHIRDWREGDPTWKDDKGKGLIGAINYLAAKGMNVFSFLTMNIEGDDQNVFPYTNYSERLRMDISKLDQWEIVFDHGDKRGMYLHFKTAEQENDQLLDGGELGVERKLYYRELIARFGHHLALNWNLGEENTNTTQQQRDFAEYINKLDPYKHIIVVHTFPDQHEQVYRPLLGSQSYLRGASIQTNRSDFSRVHEVVVKWVTESQKTGVPWIIAVDEPGDAQHALITDEEDPTHDEARKNALWGTLMGGGAGVEWYFGYRHPHSDLTCQDWRSRDKMWELCKIALNFFKDNKIPYHSMISGDELCSNIETYCFYHPGDEYIVYFKNGGTTTLDLTQAQGGFQLQWFNPRTGQYFHGTGEIQGGRKLKLGPPPKEINTDWVLLLKKA